MTRAFLAWGLTVAVVAMLSGRCLRAADEERPLVEKYLQAGDLAGGEKALLAHLKDKPGDSQARFSLGVLQALRGIEHLGQNLYRYGALHDDRSFVNFIPFLRLPVPRNPDPAKITYEDFRGIFKSVVDDLGKAEATLAKLADPAVKLPLKFGLIRLDLNGDGKAGEDELLWKIYAAINRGGRLTEAEVRQGAEAAAGFEIKFDQGDVHWLRGYCHLLSALAEMVLAYDQERLFTTLGREIFPRSEPAAAVPPRRRGGFESDILLAVTFIHLFDFPIKDEKRMPSALHHLEAVIEQSRLSWQAIQAETDDDREWIPNPKQKGVIPGVRVTQEMINGWHQFLGEAEQLLAGKKLIPHYFLSRDPGEGINLRRVFTEPRRFDLVLWVQGSGVAPYWEKGDLTSQETWNRFERLFGGEFIGFAFWFN
jgi:hypothetical protein